MRLLQAVAVCLVFLVFAEQAHALPKFSARTGWKCQSCHVNPSGGGMRNPGGVTYGREELPVPTWSEELGLEEFSTDLSKFVSVGADVRTLFFYQQAGDESQNAIFQMQGDLYINLKLAKKVNVYFDKGLYSGFEIFGQLSVLPENGYIKAGKFVPNYGLKLDDHRSYVREYIGFSPEVGNPYFTGAELGIAPGPFSVTAGVFNSSEGRGESIASEKSFLGRVEGLFDVADDVYVGLGGNIFYKELMDGKSNYVGGFGALGIADFTVIGEVDLLKSDMAGVKKDGLVVFVEGDYMVVQGFDLKAIYDFYDEDLDLATGTQSRYSFGFEFFPVSGVEVRPLYRIVKEEPTEIKNDEFHLLLHFYL
jgi:hypothetical protein